jgi:hypothetical protein
VANDGPIRGDVIIQLSDDNGVAVGGREDHKSRLDQSSNIIEESESIVQQFISPQKSPNRMLSIFDLNEESKVNKSPAKVFFKNRESPKLTLAQIVETNFNGRRLIDVNKDYNK